jgi:hypothetical protein
MLTGRWAACHRQDAGDRSGFCLSSALTSECAQPPRPQASASPIVEPQSILWPPSAIERGDLSVQVLSDHELFAIIRGGSRESLDEPSHLQICGPSQQ